MMNIFTYQNYKKYLKERLTHGDLKRPGIKTELAKIAGCQSPYISQVLNGDNHLSMEQAYRISIFLGLTKKEKDFFMILIELARAGSHELKIYYRKKLMEISKTEINFKEKLQNQKEIDEEFKGIYYSSWIYTSIHMIVTIPQFNTSTKIAKALNLDLEQVNECLELLTTYNLINFKNGFYSATQRSFHIHRESPFVNNHHHNMRIKALNAINKRNKNDLFYSSVISLSRTDAYKIKDILLETTKTIKEIIKDSPEEIMATFNFDLFHWTE